MSLGMVIERAKHTESHTDKMPVYQSHFLPLADGSFREVVHPVGEEIPDHSVQIARIAEKLERASGDWPVERKQAARRALTAIRCGRKLLERNGVRGHPKAHKDPVFDALWAVSLPMGCRWHEMRSAVPSCISRPHAAACADR